MVHIYKVFDKKFSDFFPDAQQFFPDIIFLVIVSFLSHIVSWIVYGTQLYWFLIVALYFYISIEDTYFQHIRE